MLQERIITKEYGVNAEGVGEKFSDSQFLVFINRLSALIVAGIYIQMKRQPKHGYENLFFAKFGALSGNHEYVKN